MVRPESLKSVEYQPWSRGRGIDVWAMICAAIIGDLETIKNLIARDRGISPQAESMLSQQGYV